MLQQQQQKLNQLNQPFLQPGLNSQTAELSNFYGSTAPNANSISAASAVAASNAFDGVNSQSRLLGPNLQYFGGPNNKSNQNQQQQQLLYNSSLMPQPNTLTESGAYNLPNSNLMLNGSIGVGANYSCAAAGQQQSYSFNRNRYMPYSRTTSTTGTTLYPPNNALTLQPPMPRPLSALPLTTAINTATQQMYASYQQLSNIYRSYSNLLGGPPLASTAVTTAMGVGSAVNAPNESGSDKNNNILTDSNRRATATLANGGPTVSSNPVRRSVNTVAGAAADGNTVAPNEGNANVASATRGFDLCYGGNSQSITLQITNLDYTMEESSLRNFLMGQLKPITPVLSLVFEGNSYAKVTVPDMFVSNLSYKSIFVKRLYVPFTYSSPSKSCRIYIARKSVINAC